MSRKFQITREGYDRLLATADYYDWLAKAPQEEIDKTEGPEPFDDAAQHVSGGRLQMDFLCEEYNFEDGCGKCPIALLTQREKCRGTSRNDAVLAKAQGKDDWRWLCARHAGFLRNLAGIISQPSLGNGWAYSVGEAIVWKRGSGSEREYEMLKCGTFPTFQEANEFRARRLTELANSDGAADIVDARVFVGIGHSETQDVEDEAE